MTSDFDEYYEVPEPGRRERAFGWATAIGLQQVDGLRHRGSKKTGEWYFESLTRNRVRYE